MMELRFRGRAAELSPLDRRALMDRSTSDNEEIRSSVASTIATVRSRGDGALRELGARFDGVMLDDLEVPRRVRRRALDSLDIALRDALERAAANLAAVHRAALPVPSTVSPEPGISITRRPDPLARVGIYAPGGRAAYPSSVLMGAVPAQVAGVGEVILCSPPSTEGVPPNVVLAAAELAGVSRVFAVGGAGAIAALAVGTETVPRVDRIVGPGNAYVAEAKLQLVGSVAIDSPAGPSELLVIVDSTSAAEAAVIELLAQAEHDARACAVAICVGDDVASRVVAAFEKSIDAQPRASTIRCALRAQGGVLSVDSIDDAIDIANAYAPEHLMLLVQDAERAAGRVRNAGAVFVGETSSVAFGDYMTGANHVLPTGGLARAYSGLSVLDFIRWTTIQTVDRRAARALSVDTEVFARAEGLPGHAMAAGRWSGV